MRKSRKTVSVIIIVLIIFSINIPMISAKGIPVIDISVIEKMMSIFNDVKDWFTKINYITNLLKDINQKYIDKFLNVYEKIKNEEFKEIGLGDIEEILKNGAYFWDCFGKNTWWEIWSGKKTVYEMYPQVAKKIDLKELEYYKKDKKFKEYIDYIIPIIKNEKKDFDNYLELQKKLKELSSEVFYKLEGFNERIDTSSRLTGEADEDGKKVEEGEQVKVVRVLFNVIKIKIEQLAQKYKELIVEREKIKGFIKISVRNYLIAEKLYELNKNDERKI